MNTIAFIANNQGDGIFFLFMFYILFVVSTPVLVYFGLNFSGPNKSIARLGAGLMVVSLVTLGVAGYLEYDPSQGAVFNPVSVVALLSALSSLGCAISLFVLGKD